MARASPILSAQQAADFQRFCDRRANSERRISHEPVVHAERRVSQRRATREQAFIWKTQGRRTH